MDKIDRIKEFVFATYAKLDIDLCLKYIFFTLIGTVGLVYLYKNTISKILTILFSVICISYYLLMIANKIKRYEPISRIMVNSIFLLFITIHSVSIAFLILSENANVFSLILCYCFVFAVGFIYIWFVRKKINDGSDVQGNNPQRIKTFATIGALLGIIIVKAIVVPQVDIPLSAEQEKQFIAAFLIIISFFTDMCFIGFFKVYYIKKYNLTAPDYERLE